MISNLRSIEAQIYREAAAANEDAARAVLQEAKARCPVDTGRLRDSLEYSSSKDGFTVGSPLERSIYPELGTRNQVPKPYLVPGVQSSLSSISTAFRRL